jgi:hypothetical protein
MRVTQNIYFLCIVVSILHLNICYGADNKTILNEILKKPAKLLSKNLETYKLFMEEEQNLTRTNPSEWFDLVEKYEKIDPIFMLEECLCLIISRIRQPQYRAAFENAILTEYAQKLWRKNIITCVSFASGGGFQDLVILCKLLSYNPYAIINLHMIDPEYHHYIKRKKKADLPKLISLDQEVHQIAGVGFRYQQMLRFLENTFSHATVRLYAHKTVTDFFEYAKKFNIAQDIDLIYTADIDDDKTVENDYKILCARALEINRNTINIELKKDLTRITKNLNILAFPYLLRYSLSPFSNRLSEKIQIDHKDIVLYYTTRSIDLSASAIRGFFQNMKSWFS